MMIKNNNYLILIFVLLSFNFASNISNNIDRPYKESGAIESLIEMDAEYHELILVQLDVLDDSLLSIINTRIPAINLNVGLGSYHRIFPTNEFNILQEIVPEDIYKILKRPYSLPNDSRQYWVEVKQGGDTHGTYTEDDAISYTCDCIDGASDCVKLGWYSWYNPLDYWGEAWWSFSPPEHTYVNEIRVTIRGGQCDDLPLWSETYMGMKDENGNWSEDYELSIEYTDNTYVVPEVWSEGMLMPIVGSEDNYVIDEVTLQFFYTCLSADSPTYVVSSDGNYCDYVNITWDAPDNSDDIFGYNLYRDGQLITTLQSDEFNFSDYGASQNTIHEYCVASFGECGESEYSCNDGSIKNDAYNVTNVNATDGLYEDIIIVTWDISENADQYKVYRDGVWIAFITSNSSLEFIDEYIDFQTEYNYCIEAMNDCGNSDFICDIGYASYEIGDINEDSSLDVLDVVLIVNFIMGYDIPTNSQEWASDINNDEIINIQDIILLVSMILN